MHRCLRTVMSFQRVAHLAKKCVNATIFRTICGKTKKTRKFLCISEAELLRFDCVNQVSLQRHYRAQLRLICFLAYRSSSRPVIS